MKTVWAVLHKLFLWASCGLIGFLLCVHDIAAGKFFILVLVIIAVMLSVFLTFIFGNLYEDEIAQDK